jgi:hypothetical protein
MKIKITFAFIIISLLRGYSYSQIKNVKHNQLPAYVEHDTLILYDVWIQTAKEEAKQLEKIDKLERKLKNVTEILHQKRRLSLATQNNLTRLDSLKRVNDSLRVKIDQSAFNINKDLKAKVNALNSRNKVLQSQVSQLRKVRKKLRLISITSSGALVTVVLIAVLI